MQWKTRQPDPTPEEIRERCREFQDGWDERTERQRAGREEPDNYDRPTRISVETD